MDNYRICQRCVMDTSASEIVFNDDGSCQFCTDFLEKIKVSNLLNYEVQQSQLNQFLIKLKKDGQNKKYDCIVGLSGGVDSSWVLVQAVKLGLRPLAVHMDNGWNSEIAQNNIENLVKKLNVDLFTYVIDWSEYRDLQEAFFNADVVDIELLYDNALAGVNYMMASKYNIKYILSGSNTATEGVQMPKDWAIKNKYDYKNIISIWKKCGKNYPLKTFPGIGFINHLYFNHLKKIRWVPFLNYLNYNKNEVVSTLTSEFDFVPYPYKHYESVFTRFYQGYILPKKFGFDKRKNHLSALVLTGQMTRIEALLLLEKDPYPDQIQFQNDFDYVLKKFSWKKDFFLDYISRPMKAHESYGSENIFWDFEKKISVYVKKMIR